MQRGGWNKVIGQKTRMIRPRVTGVKKPSIRLPKSLKKSVPRKTFRKPSRKTNRKPSRQATRKPSQKGLVHTVQKTLGKSLRTTEFLNAAKQAVTDAVSSTAQEGVDRLKKGVKALAKRTLQTAPERVVEAIQNKVSRKRVFTDEEGDRVEAPAPKRRRGHVAIAHHTKWGKGSLMGRYRGGAKQRMLF